MRKEAADEGKGNVQLSLLLHTLAPTHLRNPCAKKLMMKARAVYTYPIYYTPWHQPT